jgi:hypothetical protein
MRRSYSGGALDSIIQFLVVVGLITLVGLGTLLGVVIASAIPPSPKECISVRTAAPVTLQRPQPHAILTKS